MLTVVIQAGGSSTRMGQDKALMPFLGKPLIQRLIERLAGLGDELLITTNHPESFSFLGVPLIPDLLPGYGALGGLYTALSSASQPLVAVLACDLPFANATLLAALRDRLIETGSDLAVPRSAQGLEPLHAVYRRETCLPLVKASLDASLHRVDSWFTQARIEFFSVAEVQKYDPKQMAFYNVNTPQDLKDAERKAQELKE